MCLLFLYLNDDVQSDYRLVVASNRDEYWVRPTDTAKFRGDNPQWLGGMDLEPGREGGTWLGLSVTGRFSALLNVLTRQAKDKKGRGTLVKDFICGNQSGDEYMEKIDAEKSSYNPFQLVSVDLRDGSTQAYFVENVNSSKPQVFPPGVYGFDNSDDRANLWQKTVDGQTRFANIVSEHSCTSQKTTLIDRLYDLLNDKTQFFPDKQLQKQFSAVERISEGEIIEQRSARFVFSPLVKYGTRTNTVILVDQDGNCEYLERSLDTPVDIDKPTWTSVQHTLKLQLRPVLFGEEITKFS